MYKLIIRTLMLNSLEIFYYIQNSFRIKFIAMQCNRFRLHEKFDFIYVLKHDGIATVDPDSAFKTGLHFLILPTIPGHVR